MIENYLWLIPGLPLAASLLTGFLGYRFLKHASHWPCVLGTIGSFLVSCVVVAALLQRHAHEEPVVVESPGYTWFKVDRTTADGLVSDFDATVRLRADALTGIMLLTVTFISSFIAIYSIGYMHDDPGYPRFFAELALFVASMTGLVLAYNFILLYGCWEGVGLCSYLLIGFWYAKPAAADAARKAFLVTRLGDTGLILGILLLWRYFGPPGFDFRYDTLFAAAQSQASEYPGLMTAICLLLFCGAVGKSAQFPLHVWLPDAMEGPTPVSALIHASTMVTAGVYLVARCMPLFRMAPVALLVVAAIGTFTAFMAAIIALTQNDLKRVLAYSTVSQLGYMFLALGSGVTDELVPLAVMGGIFHLMTHAFFKSLLFLSAGSVMHAMGGVIDMRRFSGLRAIMPRTHLTFLCGALALAGVPIFSGFWSKDIILGASYAAYGANHRAYFWLFLAGVFTAGLTGFYTFRAYFMTFWGEERLPPEAGHHAHESPPVMTVPLMVLAVGAVGAGLVFGPTGWFGEFLGQTPGLGAAEEHLNVMVATISGLAAIAGIVGAYAMYVRTPSLADRLVRGAQGLYQASLNKLYFDEIYDLFVIKPLTGAAVLCRVFDQYILDGLVDLIGQLPRLLGRLFQPIQNGLVQFYALAMVLGMTVFLIALMRALGG
jgi:NADH-quinone oxidoreductase subunit L